MHIFSSAVARRHPRADLRRIALAHDALAIRVMDIAVAPGHSLSAMERSDDQLSLALVGHHVLSERIHRHTSADPARAAGDPARKSRRLSTAQDLCQHKTPTLDQAYEAPLSNISLPHTQEQGIDGVRRQTTERNPVAVSFPPWGP